MAYNPLVDFLGLLRITPAGVVPAQMPGLDYVVAALARAGQFSLFVGQSPPTANQTTTVWVKPSLPSWVAEGAVYLWSTAVQQFVLATPDLWKALLTGYSFQSALNPSNVAVAGTSLIAIQRAAPASTTVALPSVLSQAGKVLRVADWSTGVVNHAIIVLPLLGETIMQRSSWELLSTADQLQGIALYPSTDLNGWVIE